MPQISLYIDEQTLKKIEHAAARQRVSVSKWVAEQLRAKLDPSYPPDFSNLFGSIGDDSFQRPSQPSSSSDLARENL